jgi:hypothetical protein
MLQISPLSAARYLPDVTEIIASQHRDETRPYDLPRSALPAEQLISATTKQAKSR